MADLWTAFTNALQSTFGAVPKATKGAAHILAPEGLPVPTPEPEPDPTQLMSVAPEAPPPAPAIPEPTPASITEPGAAPTKLSKAAKPKPKATAGTAAAATPSPTKPSDSSTADPIQQMLADRRAKLAGDREKALSDAKAQESMSDDEKLAYALLGALPGLVGLIGGAAAGGGLGAAAGAAGGLQGSAQGMQQIAAGKQEKRKEALAQAAKLQDAGFKLDDEDISNLQHQGDQRFSAAQTDKTLAAHALEGARNRANALALKRMDIFGDLMKGKGAADAAGGKMTEQQERTATLLPTMQQANAIAKQMELHPDQIPQTSGLSNAMNSLAPESLESEAYKKYHNATMSWTGSYLFKVSGAAVPETEIKRYSQALFARPGDSPQLVQQKQVMRDKIEEVMRATLNRTPQDVQAALITAGVPADLATYHSGGAAVDIWSKGKPVN